MATRRQVGFSSRRVSCLGSCKEHTCRILPRSSSSIQTIFGAHVPRWATVLQYVTFLVAPRMATVSSDFWKGHTLDSEWILTRVPSTKKLLAARNPMIKETHQVQENNHELQYCPYQPSPGSSCGWFPFPTEMFADSEATVCSENLLGSHLSACAPAVTLFLKYMLHPSAIYMQYRRTPWCRSSQRQPRQHAGPPHGFLKHSVYLETMGLFSTSIHAADLNCTRARPLCIPVSPFG